MGLTPEVGRGRGKLPIRLVLQVVISLAVVGAVFFFALPKLSRTSCSETPLQPVRPSFRAMR